jgi:hypothetical protein
LIIDQDDIERRYIATVLAADGFDIIQVGSVVEGMVQEMAHEPALIVVAEETPPVRVDEVIALIRRLSNAPVIIVGEAEKGRAGPLGAVATITWRDPFGARSWREGTLLINAPAQTRAKRDCSRSARWPARPP